MQDTLLQLKREAQASLDSISTVADLETFRVDFLGRKGKFTQVMRQIGNLPASERPKAGQLANELRRELEALYTTKGEEFAGAHKKSGKGLDLSLSGRRKISTLSANPSMT